MRLASVFVSIAIGLLGIVHVSAQDNQDPLATVHGARSEVYKKTEDLELRLWVFDPKSDATDSQRPAIVFFIGNGLETGAPLPFQMACRYFARQGMVAIVADNRLSGRRRNTLADGVDDAKSAIRWIRRHASRLGIDPQRVVASGDSSGGHLAACTVMVGTSDDPDATDAVPDALALFNPTLVLAPFDGIPMTKAEQSDFQSRSGVSPETISPIHQLRSDSPPATIFHGQGDGMADIKTLRRYVELNESLGNVCRLIEYPGPLKALGRDGGKGEPGEYDFKALIKLHAFLHELGYLDSGVSPLLPSSKNVNLRSSFSHSFAAINEKREATIAFIGGSITEMAGYRVILEEWFRNSFPDTRFTFINAGISSTCSTTGAFRLARDVLEAKPDLLLIEFAVNDDQDAAHSREACIRGMEGILRHSLETNPPIDLVVTYFVNPPMLELLRRGETPVSIAAHETVASHYGISTVHLAQEVADRINEGKLTWKEYGGTHPATPGNALAATMVQDLLSTAWRQASRHRSVDRDELTKKDSIRLQANPSASNKDAVQKRELASGGNQQSSGDTHHEALPKMLDDKSYRAGRLIDTATASCDADWKLGVPDWSKISGAMRKRFESEQMLQASAVGAELKLSFEGTAIGLYVLAGPDAGRVEYSIDGSGWEDVDLYHRFSKGLHYPRTVILNGDLNSGTHELVLRVAPPADREKAGTAVRILSFTAN